jgi:hypothetical protein
MSRPLINLIIPDVHLKMDTVQRILNRESYDAVYFLGDFFDDWNDTPTKNAQMAQKLNEWMNRDDCHFIYGNHDAHYVWDDSSLPCSGFEELKKLAIRNFLNLKLVDKKFWFFYRVDGWILTHAGLDARNYPATMPKNADGVATYLAGQSATCREHLVMGRNHWFTRAGFARGGNAPIGGILWCDWFDEFHTIQGVNQIVGHTFCGANGRANVPNWKDAYNVNLDTNLKYYAILVDGKLEIKRTLDII